MHDPNLNASPVNPLPGIVIALAVFIVGVEVLFQLGEAGLVGGPEAVGWRVAAIKQFGVFSPIFDWMVTNRTFPPEHILRFVVYPFIHTGFSHVLFAGVLTLAMGKFVGDVFHPLSIAVVFFASAIIGAVGYCALTEEQFVLVGAYPAVYGLIGAYTWIHFFTLSQKGENRMQAFTLIAFLMGIQLFYKLAFGGTNDWIAELIGFATGFTLSPILSPGGSLRLRDWITRVRTNR